MKKRPISRAVELLINWQGGATALRADGILRNNDDKAIFIGLDENDDTTRLTLNGSLRGVGRPIRAASTNMFRILRNRIDQQRDYDKYKLKYSSKLAEEANGRSSSSYDRALRSARHFIRKTAVGKMDDGRLLAIAWMHDGQQRGNAASGPAWALFEGDEEARFVSDLTIIEL